MTDDQKLLQERRQAYLSESREKIENLHALLTVWADAPDDAQAFQAFQLAVHSLVGSGASSGVPRISEAAKAYENFLNWFKSNKLNLNPPRLGVMLEAIKEMESIFAGERDGLPVEVSACRVLSIFQRSTE